MAHSAAEIQKLYIAYFNRPADPAGLAYWTGANQTQSLTNIAESFALQPEYATVNAGLANANIINGIYVNLFNHNADTAGLLYWVGQVNSGALSIGVIALAIVNGALAADLTAINSKTTAATSFTTAVDTTPEILAYSGATANAAAKAWLSPVVDATTLAAAQLTQDAAIAAIASVTGTTGTTFTLTTSIDILTGTANNDTFVSDNASLSAADALNGGAGTDTVKIYGVSAANALVLPTLTSVEKVYFNAAAASVVYDASTNSGITSVELDAQAGTAANVKVTTGQAVTLSNNTAASFVTTISGNTPTSLGLTLNNIGNTAGTVDTVDFSGTALTTLNITGATTKSSATLTNTGAKIVTINVDGAANVTLIENAAMSAAVKTINASTATGAVSVDTTAGAKAAAFAFTGGAGNDTLKLAAGDLALLTVGSQLDGGAGTGDKIVTLDTTFAAADYVKINAVKGFEVLGTGAAAAVVDASQLTTIKSFAIDGDGIQAYTNLATGSTVSVSVAHAAVIGISGAVGVNDLSLAIGNSATTGFTIGGNLTIGETVVALSSNGTNAAANVITNLLNADNSTYTVTGSNDLTITAIRATAIGTKIDGTAFTGKLVVTGNATAFSAGSSLGDILIGGSAADTLKASINGGTLTGNGGADNFNVSVALGGITATFQTTTITDFTKGDKITFGATAGAFTAAKVDLSGAASVGAALNLLAAGNNSDVKWGVFGGNTYIVDDVDAGATFAATDTMVKLTGTLDLSTSTLAAVVLTFA